MRSQVVHLLDGKGSFYGVNPERIAQSIEQRLIWLTSEGWLVKSVTALPDFHNVGSDGGVKDILFLVEQDRNPNADSDWSVVLTVNSRGTMHGWQTVKIVEALDSRIEQIESEGFEIEFLVPLTDHHDSAMFEGIGGYDGTKNVLLCCRRKK